MRVLHVAPYTSAAFGGPGVAIRSMARIMCSRGAEIDVITTTAAGDKDLSLQDGAICIEDGVKVRYFNRKFPRGWFRAPGMDRWLRDNAKNYDLLHLHVPFTSTFRAGAQAARRVGLPYVATLHGLLDPWSLRQKTWKKKPYLRILERSVLADAAILHATSPLEQDFVKALCFGPEVHCIPLAVPLPPLPARPPKAAGCARVLCIARLHPVKALPVLLAALANLHLKGFEVHLDLAGQGEDGYVKELHKQARSLGLTEFIIWHGHVDALQKERLYSKADCFALLSYHENFGLAAAEAMGAGLPVVVSDQVGLAQDVLAFQAGFVVPAGNDEAAAQGILGLLESSKNECARIQARFLARQRYGEEACAEGLTKLYQAAMPKGSKFPCPIY